LFISQQIYSVAVTAETKPDSTPNTLIHPSFCFTNIKTTPILGSKEGEVTFVNGEQRSDEAKFLYDIQKKRNTYYAKSTDDMKKIRDLLNGHKDHILLYMHGFTAPANYSLRCCAEYNSQKKAAYLVVPIVWNTHKRLSMYEVDRRNCVTNVAPALTKFLEQMLQDQENWQHKYSIMCHSMGNHILRIVA
jgi:esterase/lipase superfamily enzyme